MSLYTGGAFDESYAEDYETTDITSIDECNFDIPEGMSFLKASMAVNGDYVYVKFRDRMSDNSHYTGTFTLSSFLHNCGIIILSQMCVGYENSFKLAFNIAKAMGYSQILYSVAHTQTDEIGELLKNGFELLPQTVTKNNRSGNMISIYFKNI